MKMYDYIVTYKFSKEGYLTPCEGTIQISRKKKIKTFEDIENVKQFILEHQEDAFNLGIYNIILLGRNKH